MWEPLLGYHPCSIGFLTSRREPAVGQCQAGSLTGAVASERVSEEAGSLTGAVASERVSEAPKGSLRMVGNHSKSAKAEGSLTATQVGDEEAWTPVYAESLLGYHPCDIGFLTSRRNPAVGQCHAGSLTGAVASERVSEALKVSLRIV